MNSDRYFDAKTFLEKQVKLLLKPVDLTQDQRDEILELLGDEDDDPELLRRLERVLSRFNKTRKQYLQRIFTHQATRHIALQLLESEKSAYKRALNKKSSVLDLIQLESDGEEEEEDDDSSDERAEQHLRERLRKHFALMPEAKLVELTKDLLETKDKEVTGGYTNKLQRALDGYFAAKDRKALYKKVEKAVKETITEDPQSNVQPHLLHPRPDMLNLIGRLKSVSARVAVKASYNPDATKRLLKSQKEDGEEEDMSAPDLKRQKLIVNNDPSDLLKVAFAPDSSST